jgi:hypothetical protein
MADRNLVTVLYHADDGTFYRTKQDAALIAQQDAGDPITGAVALVGADGHEELPSGLKPRGVYVVKTGQNTRFVACMEPTAKLYLGTVTSVNMTQLGGSAVAYTRHKAKSEKDHRKEAKPATA